VGKVEQRSCDEDGVGPSLRWQGRDESAFHLVLDMCNIMLSASFPGELLGARSRSEMP